jgi:type I restriction enzyme S subunit
MNEVWKPKKLGEVCGFVRGPFGGSLKKQIFIEDGFAVFEQSHAIYNQFDKVRYFIDDNKFKEMARFEVHSGNLIMSCSGTMGKVAIVPDGIKQGIINQALLLLKPTKYLLNTFLKYWIESPDFQQSLKAYSLGAAIQNVASVKTLKEIQIPLPPIPEQKRIVAILDKAFAAIDQAKANAEKNLQNSRELFESYLNKVFAPSADSGQRNPGEDWEEKKLGEIAKVIGGFSFKSKDFKKSGKYQVLRMGNVRPGIIRPNEKPVFINSLDENILNRSLLKPNDVIITQTGTKKKRDYGYTAIIDNTNYLLNQRIAAIRFDGNYSPKFFLYYSWTNYFKDQYFLNETGTVGQGNVGINAITDALVPFCKLSEQNLFVKKIDDLLLQSRKLGTIYQQKLADLEELKKSILQKAFDGQLTRDN